MDLFAACSSMRLSDINSLVMDVTKEEKIKRFVRSFKAVPSCHTVDRLPRHGYGMDPAMRKQRITARLAEIVRVQHQVCTGYFQFFHPLLSGEEEERESVKNLMSAVLTKGTHDPELNAYIESRDHNVHPLVFPRDCIAKHQSKHNDLNYITLLKSEKLTDGDRIGIYNIGNESILLIPNQGDLPVDLNSLEGAVLNAVDESGSGLTWHFSARYCRNEKASIDMNPILIENSTGCGEVFLPPDAVQDIVSSTRDDGFKPPVYPFSGDPKDLAKLKTGIQTEFVNNECLPFSFVVMNDCDCHMVAVRLMHINERVVIYIHEGLSPVDMEAKSTRSFVIQGVKLAIPKDSGSEIICLTTPVPEEGEKPFQIDYRSCGTIATDVIIDFEKTGFGQSLSDWLTLIVNMPEIDSWFYIQQEEGNSCLDCSVEKRQNIQIKELFIPLNRIHALLLKHYQGDRKKLTSDQLSTIIDESGHTLEGYYNLLCQENGGRNISSDFWTYLYLPYWEDMIEQFQSVSLNMSHGQLNSWLEKYHNFQISPEDWSMLKHYEIFIEEEASLKDYNGYQLNEWARKNDKFADWIEKLVNKHETEDRSREFLFSWCQFINDNNRNQAEDVCNYWIDKKPEDLARAIRKTVDQIRNYKCCPYNFHAGVLSGEINGVNDRAPCGESSEKSDAPDVKELDRVETSRHYVTKRKVPNRLSKAKIKRKKIRELSGNGKPGTVKNQALIPTGSSDSSLSRTPETESSPGNKSPDSPEYPNMESTLLQYTDRVLEAVETNDVTVNGVPCEEFCSYKPIPGNDSWDFARGDSFPQVLPGLDGGLSVQNEVGNRVRVKTELDLSVEPSSLLLSGTVLMSNQSEFVSLRCEEILLPESPIETVFLDHQLSL